MSDATGLPPGTDAGEEGRSTHIGPYRILGEAGRGGMGTVYLAERDDGQFRKRVALKVIREESTLPQMVLRFVEERRILASLEHPGIALLLDGGIADSGAPYYAMEFVDGVRIDRWCDARQLDIEGRLELFLQVCDAVAYAHRNLVVHRDLKPANILVTDEGRVKLLDFGVARLLTPEEGDAPTVLALRLLTPEYASPEQLLGSPVTTASDIYSLGVLLHQLLTGRLPLRDPPSGSLEGWDGGLREDPSTVARRTDPEGPALQRGTTPERLARRLRGDLDAILRRALARDPALRYGTVEALGEDLGRHLRGRPVEARRGSAGYVARRFVQRHRWVLSAAATATVLGLGMGVAYTRAVAAERDVARAQAARADQVSGFLVDLFGQSDPLGTAGSSGELRQFLALGAERLREELRDQPQVRASLLRALGQVNDNLGNYEQAEELFQEALELRLAVLPPLHDDLAEILTDLGALRRRQGSYAASDSLLRQALDIRSGRRPSPRRMETLEELAGLLLIQQELAAADSLLHEVLLLRMAAHPPDPKRVSDVLNGLGILARQRGDAAGAEAHHRQALELRRQVLGHEHLYVAESLRNLALTLQTGGRYAEARDLYEEALVMQVGLVGESHPTLTATRNGLGALLRTLGDLEGAEAQYRAALDLQRAISGDEHPDVALALTNLALVYRDRGALDQAESQSREALEVRRRAFSADHPAVAQSLNILGGILRGGGRLTEAEAFLREAESLYIARFGPGHSAVAINRTALARVLLDAGRAGEAEELFRSALEIHDDGGRGAHPDTARPLLGLAQALRAQGRISEAGEPLARALELQRTHFPEDHPDTLEVMEEMRLMASAGAGV